MLNWTDAQKQAFQSGIQKYLTLTFSGGTVIDNEEIQTESMQLTQTICSETDLKYGLCYASEFSVVVFVTDEIFTGQTVTVTLTADSYMMTLGTFIVDSCALSDDRTYRTIIAYDSLYSILQVDYAQWIAENFTFPTTLGAIRTAFFTHIGITQESTTLINDGMTVMMMDTGSTVSGSDILTSLGEINGVFGFIDYTGTFRWITIGVSDTSLYPSTEIFPLGAEYPTAGSYYYVPDGEYVQGSLTYAEGAVDAPTRIKYTGSDGGVYTYGAEGVDYEMSTNIFMNASTTAIINGALQNLYGKIAGVSYVPTTIRLVATPWLEVGDSVFVKSRFGDNLTFPILNRVLQGITGLTDSFTATGTGKYSNSPNGIEQKRIQALQYAYMAQYSISITPSNLNYSATPEATCTLTAKVFHAGNELTNLSGLNIVWSDGVLGQTRTGVPINATYTVTLERM